VGGETGKEEMYSRTEAWAFEATTMLLLGAKAGSGLLGAKAEEQRHSGLREEQRRKNQL